MGVSRYLVNSLQQLYRRQQAAVSVEDELTDWFQVTKGVRQGCLVSPICFNFYSEAVMRESAGELSWIGVNISGRTVNNLRFADDIVLIATSPERLQELLDLVNTVSLQYRLEISTKKTKVMAATKQPTVLRIFCQGVQLEQVSTFKYLGAIIDETAGSSREVSARLGAARTALSSLDVIWKERVLKMSTKMRMLRALVWPVVTYGCEAWTLHAKDTQKTEAFEMKCYRKLLRVSWTEHRTNASVLEELGIGRSLLHMIRRRKLQYFGHVSRAQNIYQLTSCKDGSVVAGAEGGREGNGLTTSGTGQAGPWLTAHRWTRTRMDGGSLC
ncbi:hypothetical protein Bbelb_100330 [Branchiostoma belcheri]|nr:hypothetical protein Bbelb_100330 [Branchiostoma belcheri]